MKLRTLLLGTTSLCLVGFMPLAATAQDAGLSAAYEAYVSAQSGDDAEAKAAAEAAFLAECQRVGAADLDGCIAIATGAVAPEEPVAEEPPPPEEPVVEEPPAEEPAVEPPPPEEPVVEEPVVEEPPPEEPVVEQPPPEEPVVEQPPVTDEQPPAEEPPPEQPVVEEPATEQPTVSPAEDPALIAAYESYVSAASGSDEAAKASAEAAFLAECNRLGIASLDECLAVMGGGVVAPPPAEEPQTEQPPAEEPTTEQPPPDQPVTEQPPATEGEVTPPATDQPMEETVPGVETEDAVIAPVLDSQKLPDGQPPADQPVTEEPPVASEPVSPPTSDEDAQVTPPVPEEEIEQTVTEQGTRIEQLPLERPPVDDVRPVTDSDRYIINIGINITIYTPYQDRDRIGRDAREVYYDELPNGRVRQTVIRDDGTEIITVWNRFGEIERRIKIRPDGTRVILVYARDDRPDDWRDPGDDLPPFVLPIPVNEYVLYSEDADEDELVAFLDQPPLEQAQRVYSIDEVKRSARIRDTVRKVDIGDITFETDSAEVSRDQVGSLTKVAQAMARIIEDDPSEVFLIEGHTDAVGDDDYNLDLSDRRAETIANLLTDLYNIPPENLTTQGYGEEYLKVLTEGPERANRRAVVRRITPLVASAGNA